MPCFFCIAVFLMIAGVVTAASVDELEEKLGEEAEGGVRRTADTPSVARLEADVKFEGRSVPVAVSVYKEHARARIQVLTHDLGRDDVEKLENHLAGLLDLRIVARSAPDSEAKVHEAFHRVADDFGRGADVDPLRRENPRRPT